MKFVFAFFIITIPTLFSSDNKELASTYISKYKDIAVQEMHRTGIPASIKLAQGLLESNWGRSDLATSANNHFGIKCGGSWHGDTFYKEDDDKDEKGRLIESCFRSFSNPMESYMAHSDFLTDPRKEYRYGFLFEYGSTDYISWAKGLKKSGYATDPKYPSKIINIVEKYGLSKFDQTVSTQENQYIFASNHLNENPKSETAKSDIVVKQQQKTSTKTRKKSKSSVVASTPLTQKMPSKYVSRLAYDIESVNNCRMVVAKGGETIRELSRTVGLSEDEILTLNEIYNQSSDVLKKDAFIYLEKKKRSYRGDLEYHEVKDGETMESIAQLYGLRVKSLYAKNRMPKKSTTFAGVRLSIRRTVGLDERPQFQLKESSRTHNLLFENDDTVK